jgi:hypothetical protein
MQVKSLKSHRHHHKKNPRNRSVGGSLGENQENRDLFSVEFIAPQSTSDVYKQSKPDKAERIMEAIITDIQSEEDAQFASNKMVVQQPITSSSVDETTQTTETTYDGQKPPSRFEETTSKSFTYSQPDGRRMPSNQPTYESRPSASEPADPKQGDEADTETARNCLLDLTFIALSIFVVLAGMSIFYMMIMLSSSPSGEETVDSTTSTYTTTTTTTTTHKTSTTSTTTISASTTSEGIVCLPPYIRFGLGCCLDVNSNDICDSDDTETTTTTLSDYVFCLKDSDCGATRVDYTCRENNVHRLIFTFFCRNPGLRSSTCERSALDEIADQCEPNEQCAKGKELCIPNWAPNNFVND